jgi:hypothetical protein
MLAPERAVKHEHDHVQMLLVVGAPIGLTGHDYRSDRCAWSLPPEPANFLPGGTPSGKKSLGLI